MKLTAAMTQTFARIMQFADQHPVTAQAIADAVQGSLGALTDKSKADTAAKSVWNSWNKAAVLLAADGADASTAQAVLDLYIGRYAADEASAKTLSTYRSRTATLVPIFQLPAEQFAEVWEDAGLKGEPSQEFNIQSAAKLIAAAKGKEQGPKQAFQNALEQLVKALREEAKPGKFEEGLTAEVKNERRTKAYEKATLMVGMALEAIGYELTPASAGSGEQLADLDGAEPQDEEEETNEPQAANG